MAKLASKVYGDALFDLAVEENRVDELAEEVSVVKTVLAENPELAKLMEHPKIVKEEKIKLLEDCFKGRVSDDMTGFLVIAVRKERYRELDSIFEYFIARVKEYKKIGIAEVVSAAALSDAWKAKIEAKLLETTKYTSMEMHYRIDESLIGGLVIRIGDRVVDSSIKAKLAELADQLSKVPLEAVK